MKKSILVILTIVLIIVVAGGGKYYPKQKMPIGQLLSLTTPNPDKYKNDCLHPCIRYINDSVYLMVQTPYYGWNNKVENPIFYSSKDCRKWDNGTLLINTPITGFNSDNGVYYENDSIFVYWREGYTPLADTMKNDYVTVGGYLDNDSLCSVKPLLVNCRANGDTEMCPILMKKDSIYRFYASWYEFEPERKNIGIAIWESKFIDKDYSLIDTIKFESVYTVDRCAQIKIAGHIFYIPYPLKHDLWHFDLFEYKEKLYMVSVAEKGDNIMLSVSDDYKHFRTYQTPLINNHYTENYVGYRQYYYKPTAFVKNDSLYLYYTSHDKEDKAKNNLYLSVESMDKILK